MRGGDVRRGGCRLACPQCLLSSSWRRGCPPQPVRRHPGYERPRDATAARPTAGQIALVDRCAHGHSRSWASAAACRSSTRRLGGTLEQHIEGAMAPTRTTGSCPITASSATACVGEGNGRNPSAPWPWSYRLRELVIPAGAPARGRLRAGLQVSALPSTARSRPSSQSTRPVIGVQWHSEDPLISPPSLCLRPPGRAPRPWVGPRPPWSHDHLPGTNFATPPIPRRRAHARPAPGSRRLHVADDGLPALTKRAVRLLSLSFLRAGASHRLTSCALPTRPGPWPGGGGRRHLTAPCASTTSTNISSATSANLRLTVLDVALRQSAPSHRLPTARL